ncbi:unnamed protein product [Paramecium octaurelia]|uniref:Uncharacterized protein n=1 Tax=Paramecium octaurelia TaxID=43137 RepID=A0A8S1Y387_PAROT|nr:unnamed protein product [Paramecium octaurelia]
MSNKSKEILLDNNNMLQNQNQLIEDICNVLEQTNQNAANVQKALLEQQEKIVVIRHECISIRTKTRRVDKQTNQIIRREFCMKLILYLIVFLLLAANIVVLAIKISRK